MVGIRNEDRMIHKLTVTKVVYTEKTGPLGKHVTLKYEVTVPFPPFDGMVVKEGSAFIFLNTNHYDSDKGEWDCYSDPDMEIHEQHELGSRIDDPRTAADILAEYKEQGWVEV